MPLNPPSMCMACTHYNGDDIAYVLGRPQRPSCTAYPDGIPVRFTHGGSAHTDPEPDQVGEDTFQLAEGREYILSAFVSFYYEPDPESDESGVGEISL